MAIHGLEPLWQKAAWPLEDYNPAHWRPRRTLLEHLLTAERLVTQPARWPWPGVAVERQTLEWEAI